MDCVIGLFTNTGDEYNSRLVRDAQEAADHEGLNLQIFDAQYTAAKQAQDLLHFTAHSGDGRRCALVIPEADAIDQGGIENDPTFRLARRVVQKGVGWIMLNHGREELIEKLRVEHPAVPIAIVSIDNVGFGRLQARQLRALLPKGGMVLYVRGNPFDSACRGRCVGMREELQQSGIVVEEADGRWVAAVAEEVVYKWLTSPTRRLKELNAVICQNDPMGAAAHRALRRAADDLGRPALKMIPVLGGDGLDDLGKPWVDEGKLAATVCVTLPGRPALELLMRHWREGAPLPPVTRLAVESYPRLADLRPVASC
jgi:ABC-type sugar transport system substrate-binding protein